MSGFIAEIVGTMLLILLGLGVGANVTLEGTHGKGGSWLLINLAWGFAVYAGVVVAGPYSGAHLNPAVTLGLAIAGKFAWASVAPFILAQCLGAAIACVLLVSMYSDHFKKTKDTDGKLGVFVTGTNILNPIPNIMSELIGTFVLLMGVFYITDPTFDSSVAADAKIGLGSVGALPIAIFVAVIGMSLGGTTGYAINPVRDLIPRLMHGILPIGDKRDSNWSYAFVPLVGPILGACAAAGIYILISGS